MLSLVKRLAATLHRQRVRRITIGELSALSDLALADIGLHRGQIRSVAEGLIQGNESATTRPELDAEASATTANARAPFAHECEHRVAA